MEDQYWIPLKKKMQPVFIHPLQELYKQRQFFEEGHGAGKFWKPAKKMVKALATDEHLHSTVLRVPFGWLSLNPLETSKLSFVLP